MTNRQRELPRPTNSTPHAGVGSDTTLWPSGKTGGGLLASGAWPIAVVLVAQFLLLANVFPLSELMSDKMLLTIDHAYHLYQVHLALDLAASGQLIGYDPLFGAGHVGGVTFNASAKLPALIALFLEPTLTPIQSYKIFVFFAAFVAPACAPIAAQLFGLAPRPTWIAAIIGLFLWWVSGFHWYHTAGMVSYVLGAFVALPYSALIWRIVYQKNGWPTALLAGALGAVGFLLHPFFPLPVALFTLILLIQRRHDYRLTHLAPKLIAVALISLLPNLLWIAPMLHAPSLAEASMQPYQKVVDFKFIFFELMGIWRTPFMGAKIYPLLAFAALWAAWRTTAAEQRMVYAFLAFWCLTVLFAALGAAVPGVGAIQPNRFSATAYLFLTIPAALGIDRALRKIRDIHASVRIPALAALALMLALTSVVTLELGREGSYGNWGRYGKPPPEVRGLGTISQVLLDWLEHQTNSSGRVLFETSLARTHDGAHMAGLLARISDREFIGGPYPFLFFAGFWDGHLFGRPIDSISPDRFADYLRRYNIGWVIAHTEKSQRYLDRHPAIKATGRIASLQTYRVIQPLSYLVEGEGNVVSRQNNRLVIRSDRAPGHPMTLKYHWVPGLHASDGSEVLPVKVGDDPQPFIQVVPKTRELEINFMQQ